MKKRRPFPRFPRRKTAAQQWFCVAVSLIAAERARLLANPAGLSVGAGTASLQTIGSQLNVTVSSGALLNWNSFNIAAGETTTFIQPSANSVVLNEIGDRNPSQIFGSLTANGTVILANANGFYFGPHSMIQVGGNFIATTAPLTPDFGLGASWQFAGLPPLAQIVNYGQIQVGGGGSLFLIAENIQNNGSLSAAGGNVGLYAGQSVLVSESPDGRGLSATVKIPSGAVDNSGRITAAAGTIALQAQVVNQNGVIQANSVQDENGVIELVASDTLALGPNSAITAQGDGSTPGSSGGTVTLKSGDTFSDSAGSQITTAGGAQGGNGGDIEVSAPNILSLNSAMNASAQTGWTGGSFLLDPANIVLGTSGSGTVPGNGTVTSSGSGTLDLDVNTAFANKSFSQILLEATGNITLNPSTTWNLSTSTGEPGGQLALEAGGNIIFNNNAKITDANDWSVNLLAGFNFTTQTVQAGAGSIYLDGSSGGTLNGAILTAHGSVNLSAGQDIQIGSGYVNTTAGGNITMLALAGSINAGTANAYGSQGYTTTPKNSGISTLAGGDITLTAGNSILYNPKYGANPEGSSGAYGPGAVTLTAGDLVDGNFLVTAGTGTILSGVTVANGVVTGIQNPAASVGSTPTGGSAIPLNLSLVSGSWNVWAANYAYIGEVRNPDGTFGSGSPYDYSPTAAFNLWAGNAITLDGSSADLGPGRNGNVTDPVYPPIMSLNAGAGGITLNNSLILFPSSQGSLQITTRADGDLTGAPNASELTGIIMSDAPASDNDGTANENSALAQDHSNPPLYAGNMNPVIVNVSGDIDTFGLTVPTFANITVSGSTYNFGFLGQNVSAAQTTSISVAGSITYRGDLSSVSLTDTLPAALRDYTSVNLPGLSDASGTLSFVGVMTPAELQFLLNPTVVEVNAAGQPALDANGNPIPLTLTLDSTQIAAINQLYTASQSATLHDSGLGISGPGQFDIAASSIDLGVSGGIFANAPAAALAAISPLGADIIVTTAGNLSMTSTKIANAGWLGGITLEVGGALDVGGEDTTLGDANLPKGIFTESGGDISIVTQGDVNVDGSRIAAYNGGNVTVESVNGNVNAGTGGSGFVSVESQQLDPVTGGLISFTAGIGGSGILATTLPGTDATLGNILVETPRGSITASQGGVLQISLNGTPDSTATAALLAGYLLEDSHGQPVSAADLNNPANQDVLVTASENVDASGSGIVAQNVFAKASGEVKGLFVGFNSVNLDATQIGPGIAFGPKVTITDTGEGGTGTGPAITVIAENPVDVNNAIEQPTAPQTTSAAKEVATTAQDANTVATDGSDTGGDLDQKKKKAKPIGLVRKVSRVTVLLPPAK